MKDKCDWLISRLNMIKGKKIFGLEDISIETSKNWKARQQRLKKMSKVKGLLQNVTCVMGISEEKRENGQKKNWNNVKLVFDTEPQIQKYQTKGSRLNSPKPSDPGISFLNYIKLKKNCPERSKRGWGGKPYVQRSNVKEWHPISPQKSHEMKQDTVWHSQVQKPFWVPVSFS